MSCPKGLIGFDLGLPGGFSLHSDMWASVFLQPLCLSILRYSSHMLHTVCHVSEPSDCKRTFGHNLSQDQQLGLKCSCKHFFFFFFFKCSQLYLRDRLLATWLQNTFIVMNHMHLSHAFTPQSVVANLTIPQTVWLQGFLQLCSKTLGEPFLGSGH